MKLTDYCAAGSKDSFVYWLEKKTEDMGSIWGGSSFKFGVYSRKDSEPGTNDSGYRYNDDYGWLQKYGETPDEAFDNVLGEILRIAQAARRRELSEIDRSKLGPAVTWKIAFLYQDKTHPCILPIFKPELLQMAAESSEGQISVLQGQLMQQAGSRDILEYVDERWAQIQPKLAEIESKEAWDKARKLADQFRQKSAGLSVVATEFQGSQRKIGKHRVVIEPHQIDWVVVADDLRKAERYRRDCPISRTLYAAALSGDTLRKAWENLRGIGDVIPAVNGGGGTYSPMGQHLAWVVHHQGIKLRGPNLEVNEVILNEVPMNTIFYGPPGTGKTYATVDAAVEILDPTFSSANRDDLSLSIKDRRTALKKRFDAFVDSGHVKFVTFHQSFSYEDFVEGLRADSGEDGQLRYEVVDGVFKSLCDVASATVTQQAEGPLDISGRQIWKMSLGNSLGSDAYIFDECIGNNYALLGWGDTTDFTGCEDRKEIFERFIASNDSITKDAYAVTAVSTFVLKMKVGDLIVVSEGNTKFRAIGEITGEYRCLSRQEAGYGQCRNVKWLRVYKPSLPIDQLMRNKFSQMTLYMLRTDAIDLNKLSTLLGTTGRIDMDRKDAAAFHPGEVFGSGYTVAKCSDDLVELIKPNGNQLPVAMSLLRGLADYVREGKLTVNDISERKVFEKVQDSKLEPHLVNGYNNILPSLVERLLTGATTPVRSTSSPRLDARVLIIDEINRGNVSRIFGELITLIEPSKRKGADEALEVTLPYSKERFSVPANIHLIGTMNTADRSLSGLDVALRRRFQFHEMPPRPEYLAGISVQGIDIASMLRALNERIEILLDRDHCIGHAYFMALAESKTIDTLGMIFRSSILPLLQEYFFEDWQRIQWVLNDHQKKDKEHCFIYRPTTDIQKLFGDSVTVNEQSLRWVINDNAFLTPEAYLGIIS